MSKPLTLLRSIRFRLALWFVVILALVLLVFDSFVYTRVSMELHAETYDYLTLKARQIANVYRLVSRTDPHDQLPPFENLYRSGTVMLQEVDAVAIFNGSGQIDQKVGSLQETQLQEILDEGLKEGRQDKNSAYTLSATLPDRKDYAFLLLPLTSDAQPEMLLIGRPFDPVNQLPRLKITLALATLATLLFALAGGYWLADRAMRPVHTITQTAREIGETDLSRRLNLGGQDELGELASTFDGMLARLQAAFDRQRQFTADASHELRTPLTIVELEAGRALAGRRSPDEYQRALGVIRAENDFMSRLVNDLLTLARMDAGQTNLRLEDLDLSDVVVEVVERLESLAQRNEVTLETGELPELPVRGDRQYLTQMLTNLVENAIKYSRGQACQVHLETGRVLEDGRSWAWARIRDTGPGIPPEHLPHLFDRFYRVDTARARSEDEAAEGSQPSGTGLGLAIVKWIVQAHGGQVRVQSEVGQGSQFEVLLPLVE